MIEEKMQEALALLVQKLPEWYMEHRRSLPWRDTGNPYDVWLSEIMLQQTRVEAVKAYFLRFKEALPEIGQLAVCPDDRLMKLWEGLGYYSRVRNLKKAAQQVMELHGGRLPADEKALLKLPGIGSYTAGAIASIAYGLPVPAVDGNVLRVCMRVAGDNSDIALPETKKQLEQAVRSVLSQVNPTIFNQALMELGAIVCVPNGQPHCEICPVREGCRALLEDRRDVLPVKSAKKPRRVEDRTILLLQNGDRFMIKKRADKGLLAGLWELPSLDGAKGEDEVLAAVRRMGFEPLYIQPLPSAKHIFTHIEWHMQGWLIRIPGDTESQEVFANAGELREVYALPSAFQPYLEGITSAKP